MQVLVSAVPGKLKLTIFGDDFYLNDFVMKQTNWFDRKFDFSTTDNILPAVIERLTGTSIRIREKIKKIELQRLVVQPAGKWSVLEQIGHLSDLEPLWQERLQDILSGAKELRLADLTNQKTTQAGHNKKTVDDLLTEFECLRKKTIDQLAMLSDDDLFKSSLHPRLKNPMRVQDLFVFVADHDDHHLAKMTENLRL